MPRGKQSQGKCAYCSKEMAKGSANKHLATCADRKQAIEIAEQKKGTSETLYHLRIQDAHIPNFWLNLEVRGSATLDKLDGYLRAIWLECCGHMSQFSIGAWSGEEISMKRKISDVFPGVELTHIYDFGTSSETLIKFVEVREGKPTTNKPIALMVRNLLPPSECIECKETALYLCLECLYDLNEWGTLCDRHLKKHGHQDNYGEPLPLVNSPRLGMCGYDGPAEPPY